MKWRGRSFITLLRVTFSASQDLTIGDDEDLGNIVHVSNGEPFLEQSKTTIENTFSFYPVKLLWTVRGSPIRWLLILVMGSSRPR